MVTLLLFVAVVLVVFRVALDLFPILEKDVFTSSEDLISFDDVEGITLNLWDKLIDQAAKEAERNPDLKCWVPTFKEMREGDIQLFLFLKNRLSKKEMRHLIGTLNYSGVYTLASEVYREEETHLDVEGLKGMTAAINTCMNNFGAAKRSMLAGARSFSDTKLAVLENFRLATSDAPPTP